GRRAALGGRPRRRRAPRPQARLAGGVPRRDRGGPHRRGPAAPDRTHARIAARDRPTRGFGHPGTGHPSPKAPAPRESARTRHSRKREPMPATESFTDAPHTVGSALDLAAALEPRLTERAADHDRAGTFPAEDFADLRRAGLLGLMAPARLGGFGASLPEYAAVAAALARGAGSTALIFNMHASVTGALAQTPDDLVRQWGAPESFFAARDAALTAAAQGALYGVAMSERGTGSRLSRTATAYRRTARGFHIGGSKAFVSGAGHVDAYLVTARDPEAEEPRVSYFLVPAGEGIRVEQTWDSLGMRATGSQDVHFDVEVGPEALLGGMEGLTLLLAQVMPQWLVASYAAVYVGVARSAVEAAAGQVDERGLGRLPAVRARLGRADAAVAAAELAVAEAAA